MDLDASPRRQLATAVEKDSRRSERESRNIWKAARKLRCMESHTGRFASGEPTRAAGAAGHTDQGASPTTLWESVQESAPPPVDNEEDDCIENVNLSGSFTKTDFISDFIFKQEESGGPVTQQSRISSPQPEEEAEESLHRSSSFRLLVEDSRRVSESEASCSRLSLPSSEPAGEPQPQDTPKEQPELFGFRGKDLDDDDLSATSMSSPCATPSGSAETDGTDEAATSQNSISYSESTEAAECENDLDQGTYDDCPKAFEDGMNRRSTLLHMIEQGELSKNVHIKVPEGITSSREVTFKYDGNVHNIVIPENFQVDDTVIVRVTRNPPLEKNQQLAWLRGHIPENNFPQQMDRISILEHLKHGGRARPECTLADPEFQQRMFLYRQLRGSSMRPLVPTVDEDSELEPLALFG